MITGCGFGNKQTAEKYVQLVTSLEIASIVAKSLVSAMFLIPETKELLRCITMMNQITETT